MNILTAGQTYDDNKIVGWRGEGKFGVVYEVSNSTSSTNVALKICTSSEDSETERFQRENTLLHKLYKHPRIIEPISKVKKYNNSLYYLMELADCNLKKLLTDDDALTVKERLKLFNQVCEGLQYIHQQGIIHRDLWWGNVLIKNREPKLNDFGRARDFLEEEQTYKEQGVWGIEYIIPPEYFFGLWKKPNEKDYMPGDIYALGIILYFIFQNTPTEQHNAIRDSIQAFKQYLSSSSISYSTEHEYYDEWVKWVSSLHIEKNLSLILSDGNVNNKINALLYKLCSLDYSSRHESVEEVIIEVGSIINLC